MRVFCTGVENVLKPGKLVQILESAYTKGISFVVDDAWLLSISFQS